MRLEKMLDDDARKRLARSFVRCLPSLLNKNNLQNAQAVLDCVGLLMPCVDRRYMQALIYCGMDQHAEAIRVASDIGTARSAALIVLCQGAIGEESWLGDARTICESGDADAIAMIEPFMKTAFDLFSGNPSFENATALPPVRDDYLFVPLRA